MRRSRNMGKLSRYISLIAVTGMMSCGDVPDNGNLDGMWHLRTVENLTDHTVEDVKADRIYYSVQERLVTLRRTGHTQCIGRFTHTGDSLFLYDFVIYQREGEAATLEDLIPFRLETTAPRYGVEKLNGKEMVLRSKATELTFKKF